MENRTEHEIELYAIEAFKIILDHEVNKSHRYGDSLTLVDLIVEAEPASPANQHRAEVFVISALSVHLRKADIPCRQNNEFLILLPATGATGARTACERLKKQIESIHQAEDTETFKLSAFVGMATLPNDDRSVTSDRLIQNASQALGHARINQISNVVGFSELTK